MDSESDRIADSQICYKRRHSQQTRGALALQNATGAEPDNKYYEVEEILDGPRKRREHLFKYCYKVRWKGYGAEADTWQPIADLANVQDMIEDYKKERAMKQREKGKKKPEVKSNAVETRGRAGSQSHICSSSEEEDSDDNNKQYDPIYGTVKDKFWKDLELGRHQNHAQLFSGDMYSKVKGCRRAAHADAVTNIQKQQQLLTKPHLISSEPSTPRSSFKLVRTGFKSTSKSSLRLSSKSSLYSVRSKSPIYSPASRVRKRSSDPFSARGYMSAKRSRRSRETKSGNVSLDGKPSESDCVSSEIVDLVSTSHDTSSVDPATIEDSLLSQINTGSSIVSQSNPDIADNASTIDTTSTATDTMSEEGMDVTCKVEESNQESVSTGTTLTVTEVINIENQETRSLNGEVQLAEAEKMLIDMAEDVHTEGSLSRDEDISSLDQSSCINVGASGSGGESSAGPSYDAGSGTSGGTLSDPSVIKRNLSSQRSTLDVQSEASGAVERSHDEDCLWNGACNRSDCKSNRRRNMKNGQRKGHDVNNSGTDCGDHNSGGENSVAENDDNQNCSTDNSGIVDENKERSGDDTQQQNCENNDNRCCVTGGQEDPELDGNIASSRSLRKPPTLSSQASTSHTSSLICTPAHSSTSKEDSNLLPSQAQNSMQQAHQPPLMSSCRSSNKNADLLTAASSSQFPSSGQTCRSLFSSYHADSSDSSFDESSSSGALLSREAVSDSFYRIDPLGHHFQVDALTGFTPGRAAATALDSSHGSSGGNISQRTLEMRKNNVDGERPGLFSDGNSAFNFTRQDSGFSGDSGSATPGGHFMLPSSAGSVNICSPGKENFGSSSSKSSGLVLASGYTRIPMAIDGPSSHHDSNTHVQPLSSQSRIFSEPSQSSVTRKRGSEVAQPLEKIPSPNSRESELDRRISTLSCDELEDFVEQGDECCSQKDLNYISNADLLQAVSLNKAEVVKHAIRQYRFAEHKLDFEQSDSTGVTLLMRAVQKGTVAIVEMLLEHGVNVNAQQTNGTTSLMIAAEQNGMCLVALLLKYGANSSLYTINTDKAETALMKAIKRQHQEVVNLMLRVGVNVAPPTCTSISALELAIERRNPHIERIVRYHCQRLEQAFQNRVLATLEGTAELVGPLFPMQCFPLRESHQFVVKFNSNINPVSPGEGFLLFIAHTKITDKGVRCRFHGGCPIGSVTLNGIVQSPLTKEVNFVTSCHPIIPGCNILIIHKLADYTSKAKLVVQAFRARLLSC